MSDRPIIKIAIDSEEFDRFTERFNAYHEKLRETNALWHDNVDQMADAEQSMAKLAASGSPDQKPDSPRRKSDELSRVKNLKFEEKTWAKIEQHVGTTSKGISELGRMTLGLNSNIAKLGGGGLGIFGAFAALYGATSSAANGLASRNMENRSLNLAPGVAVAYGKVFQKVGGSAEQLSRFETAKMNPDQWQGLLAAGLTPGEIQTDDAETVAEKFMARGSQKFLQMPEAVRGTWMRQTGVSNYASETDMNLASSYSPDDWQKMHAEFLTQRDKVADSQGDLDAGTALKTHLAENWDTVAKAFDHAVITLSPALTLWSDAATKLAVQLAEGLPGAVKKVTDLADKVSPMLPSLGKGSDPLDDAAIDVARQITDGGKWTKFYESLKSSHFNSGGDAVHPMWDLSHPFGVLHRTTADPAGDAPGTDARHNPGNMRPPGDGKHFQTFKTDADGVRAADRQLQIYYNRDHISTADGFTNRWAPASDGNRPRDYAAFLAKGMGVKTNDELDFNDPRVRSKFESLVFQYESSHHRDLTPEKVLAMYDPNYKDASAPSGKTDDAARVVKSASGEAQDMHIYAEDDPALSAHAETQKVLKKIATQKIDPQIIQIDDDGKDSKMPPILQRPPGMGQFPANQNINVKVTAPAGSSVAVTASNFPG